MSVEYEWVIEELEGPDTDDVDIRDVTHADTYAEALQFAAPMTHSRIALVRDHAAEGYTHRAWAYVTEGMLPSHLEDAFGHEVARVPDRFRRQFEKAT